MEGLFKKSNDDIAKFLEDNEYSKMHLDFYLASKGYYVVDLDAYEEMKMKLYEEVGNEGWDPKWDL